MYRDGGLEALRTSGREYQPTSELAAYEKLIRKSLEQQPARTIAEACQRIKDLTGVERGPTQVRQFLKGLGLKWQMVRAEQLGITLMFLPSYSPNLNLIERLWKFIKCRSLDGRYHPAFADFRAAIEETITQLSTTHATDLASLMTLNFQRFENLSLMAA